MAWRVVLAVYVAFYVVAIAIERHGLANLSHRGKNRRCVHDLIAGTRVVDTWLRADI
jgi:hypothetical protein